MVATHNIQAITFDHDFICITVDGKELKAPLDKVSNKLKVASDIQRAFYKVSPSGYGIHWPLLDEDIAVDALVKSIQSNWH